LRLARDTPRVAWKWTRGAATAIADFGNPTASTSYAFCVYGGAELLMGATAPAAGNCVGRPCWTARSSGYRYANRLYTPSGVGRLDLRAGVAGQARIGLKGKGPLLAVPALPIATLPLTTQLVGSTGRGGAATFSIPTRNDPTQVKATSD
jgi:hypothetical protein